MIPYLVNFSQHIALMITEAVHDELTHPFLQPTRKNNDLLLLIQICSMNRIKASMDIDNLKWLMQHEIPQLSWKSTNNSNLLGPVSFHLMLLVVSAMCAWPTCAHPQTPYYHCRMALLCMLFMAHWYNLLEEMRAIQWCNDVSSKFFDPWSADGAIKLLNWQVIHVSFAVLFI